ncbi:oligodendrocyte-myelin glycoprotein-like [Antennarius striatus]|uniref:oligodendrocyte-myelin glycoprotein-like n=1 Tax=Antennarius striatus TaxID=241820 RepID=UPI0035AE5A56
MCSIPPTPPSPHQCFPYQHPNPPSHPLHRVNPEPAVPDHANLKDPYKSRHVLLTLPLHEALLELLLVLLLGLQVNAVCPSVCSCNRSHREVDCSWRGLRQLPDGLQHNIHSLNLSHNRLHNLDGHLTEYTHLRFLDLSYNHLGHLPVGLPRSLWNLYATSNRIQLLDKNDTVYQWNLQNLDLSRNKLERVIFINNTLINLCTLNLSHNHLWTLPTNMPANLQTIDVSHNLLVKVLPGSLDRLNRLTHFRLHANRFSTLPYGVLDNLTLLRVITLGNNPWACHFYADISYIVSWTQQTRAHVLGCPCHTQPVCGQVHPSSPGGWHFASYNQPPFAATTQDLSSVLPKASTTRFWYSSVSSLLSTPHTPKKIWSTSHNPFTIIPINSPTLLPRGSGAHMTITHLSESVNPAAAERMFHTDSHLISYTMEASSTVSLHTGQHHFSDTTPATDRFLTTESPSSQTKKTTTLRTRSVRRHNQSFPRGISSSGPALAICSLLSLLYKFGLLSFTLQLVL